MRLALYITFIAALILNSACSGLKKPEALTEREKWIESFRDSIEIFQRESNDIQIRLSDCNAKMASELDKFEYVSDPRQVTGYYILKGWNSKIPFTNTAIYARVNDGEKLELIATLRGKTFNKISVSDGATSVQSELVPHDQALNYRHSNFNTVCFSGLAADSVAEYIASHHSSRLELNFIEGDKKISFTLPTEQKEMLTETWKLFATQQEQKDLQKQLWILSRKIDTSRRMLENADSLKI